MVVSAFNGSLRGSLLLKVRTVEEPLLRCSCRPVTFSPELPSGTAPRRLPSVLTTTTFSILPPSPTTLFIYPYLRNLWTPLFFYAQLRVFDLSVYSVKTEHRRFVTSTWGDGHVLNSNVALVNLQISYIHRDIF